jgi:hypothetical protein
VVGLHERHAQGAGGEHPEQADRARRTYR